MAMLNNQRRVPNNVIEGDTQPSLVPFEHAPHRPRKFNENHDIHKQSSTLAPVKQLRVEDDERIRREAAASVAPGKGRSAAE